MNKEIIEQAEKHHKEEKSPFTSFNLTVLKAMEILERDLKKQANGEKVETLNKKDINYVLNHLK